MFSREDGEYIWIHPCYRVENEFSVASLRILWSVDKSGQYTERIFPLMQLT